jgi:taspase, threonine aspartase, 1
MEGNPQPAGPFFVAVHAGAGWHSPSKEAAYRRALCDAVSAATAAIADGADPLSAAVAALRVLEVGRRWRGGCANVFAPPSATHCRRPLPQDSPATNAGRGSNLNAAGRVECDAAVMAGADGAFGALGAAPGVRHPAAAAARLAEESRLPLPLGLVRPM